MDFAPQGSSQVEVIMKLRDYQQSAYDQAIAAIHKGQKPLVIIGTGGGKTPVMATMAKSIAVAQKRVIIVAPLTQLIEQQVNTLLKFDFARNQIGVLQGSNSDKNLSSCPVVVAMAQSLAGARGKEFLAGNKFHVCLQDEKHLQWMDTAEKLVNAPINVGFTATPLRDGAQETLDDYQWIEPISTIELIRQVRLTNFRHHLYRETVQIETASRDYTPDEQKVILQNMTPKFVLQQWLKVRPTADYTLGFCRSIEQAKFYAAYFNGQGYRAEVCCEETPDDDKELEDGSLFQGFHSIKDDFRKGIVKVIFSVVKLATGYDEPLAKCSLILRPTKSLAFWLQFFGRVLRTIPGLMIQPTADILDYAGCGMRLPLPTEIDSFEDYLKNKPKKMKGSKPITFDRIQGQPSLLEFRELTGSMMPRQDPRLIADDLELIRELRYEAFWVYRCSPSFAWRAFNQIRSVPPAPNDFKGESGVLQNAIFDSHTVDNFLAYRLYLELYKLERPKPCKWMTKEVEKEFGTQGLVWLRQYSVVSK